MPREPVWYTRCPLPTAFSLVMHNGRLQEVLARHGLDLGSIRHQRDRGFKLSHFRHDLPAMLRHGGHIPPMWSRAEGRDVRLLGLSWTQEAQLVLTRPDCEINSLADLRGRRLALPLRPNYPIDFWRATVLKGWDDALATAGLNRDDVEIVPLINPQIPFAEGGDVEGRAPPGTAAMTLSSLRAEAYALIEGKVDAIYAPGHYGVALRHVLGMQVVADLAATLPRQACVNNPSLLAFTASGAFVDGHPDVIADILFEVLLAAREAPCDPAFVARVLAQESGNAEELVPEIFGAGFAHNLAPSLAPELLAALCAQGDFLAREGFIARAVPLEEWLTPAPLAAAQDRLVTKLEVSTYV